MEALRALSTSRSRIALVHDFLVDLRGADRVFLAICDIWPEADVYSTIYDEDGTEGRFSGRRIHTSFLQRRRPTARNFRSLLPLYPSAIESFDLSGYDLVVSSSSAWAHAVRCDPETVHLCYCHNPFRYAWNELDRTLSGRDPVTRTALRELFRRWRAWDRRAAGRVDRYLTNSRTTQARIKAYFGRDSTVLYPPVETARFSPGPVRDYYLVLSELMPHKRIDLTVRAFNLLRLPLVVVGDGPDARRLGKLAGPTVRFTGRVSDASVSDLLRGCRALVVAATEEFGIAAVEAQAAGRPVIAVRAGGTLETVQDGVTGCFWTGGPEELAAAVAAFDDAAIDPRACSRNAMRFDLDIFRRALPREVERTVAQLPGRRGTARLTRPAPRLGGVRRAKGGAPAAA
jgi:glycosyltransferase involved in cell wall biosynthesis